LIKKIKKILQKIFKTISYNIFFLIYGKIKKILTLDECENLSVTKSIFDNEFIYNVYKVKSGRLYTDRIHNTALIFKNSVLDGPSFQLKNNINSHIKNNIVLENGTPRLKKKITGNILSLLTGGGGNSNYWHWLFDVLPRIEIAKKVINLKKINYFLFPDLVKPFQLETIDMLNIPSQKTLSSKKFRHVSSDQIFITDHPYIKQNAHLDTQNIPDWVFRWVRTNFLKKEKFTEAPSPKKVYIDRDDSTANHAKYQNILNKDEFYNFLKSQDFKFLNLSKLKFIDQVKIFNNAELILGIHGSGFSNIIFSEKKTKIIELRSSKTGKMYENLALKNNLNYDKIIYEPINSHEGAVTLGDFKVPMEILKKKLEI